MLHRIEPIGFDETLRILLIFYKPSDMHRFCKSIHKNLEEQHNTPVEHAEYGIISDPASYSVNEDIKKNRCMVFICIKNGGTLKFSTGEEFEVTAGNIYSFIEYSSFTISPSKHMSYILFKSPS